MENLGVTVSAFPEGTYKLSLVSKKGVLLAEFEFTCDFWDGPCRRKDKAEFTATMREMGFRSEWAGEFWKQIVTLVERDWLSSL